MLCCENADELFTFAVICLNEGRYALAEKAASRAIDLDPSDAEAYQYRAAARVGLGQCMPALNDCNRAIEIDDSDEEVYRVRGAAYVGLQQYELAKADLDRVLREKVTDAEAYRLRGSAFLGMNQVRRALWDYSKSIASNPLSAEAYLDRAPGLPQARPHGRSQRRPGEGVSTRSRSGAAAVSCSTRIIHGDIPTRSASKGRKRVALACASGWYDAPCVHPPATMNNAG